MPSLGITEDGLLVYEGQGRYGHPVWPNPVISRATLIESEADWLRIPQSIRLSMIFREDSFDAVTRVRRGRLYDGTKNQPADWQVRPHPALGGEDERKAHRNGGNNPERLETFDSYRGLIERPNRGHGMLIALGTSDAVSVWQVIGVERIFTGEDLLTLKARSNLGVLPDLDSAKIPVDALPAVRAALAIAADAAFREGPTSVIDRCGEAAKVALGNWLSHSKPEGRFMEASLGKMYKHLEKSAESGHRLLIVATRMLAYLHARGKNEEQERYGHPAPVEGDATDPKMLDVDNQLNQ